jgi:hypothetical protein
MSIGTDPGGTTHQIQSELGVTIGTACTMNDSNMRTLSGTTAGSAVSFSTFYGKSNFTPFTQTYPTPGSFTETVPAGAVNVVIETWGGGGIGGNGSGTGCGIADGGGAGAGGYCRSTYSCTSGQTLNLVVGQGTTTVLAGTGSSVTSGTFSVTTMSAGVGTKGQNATLGGAGGAGGTATGGNVNNTPGTNGDAAGAGSGGAAGTAGVNGGPAGAGGHGGSGASQLGRTNGGNGLILLRYT